MLIFINMITDEKIGKEYWFEYHCYENEKSCDAEIWYRSHQKVLVLSISDFGGGDTESERAEFGEPRVYKIRFKDGLEWDVFEDELMNSPEEFFRPNPPSKISETRNIIRKILREFFIENKNE